MATKEEKLFDVKNRVKKRINTVCVVFLSFISPMETSTCALRSETPQLNVLPEKQLMKVPTLCAPPAHLVIITPLSEHTNGSWFIKSTAGRVSGNVW